VYASNGSGFDSSQNLIAGLSSIIPSYPGKNDQVQLADINGDGLTDVVYPNGGALRARVMERQGANFGWGAEKTIAVDEASMGSIGIGCDGFDPYTTCTRTVSGSLTSKTGFMQTTDFNGDAASDLLIQVNTHIERYLAGYPGCEYIPQRRAPVGEWTVPPYAASVAEEVASKVAPPNDPCWEVTDESSLHAFFVKQQDASTVGLANYGPVSSANPYNLTFADANGDGLTDVFSRASSTGDWSYLVNTGTGFSGGGILAQSDYRDQTRFQDINGDGRADVLVLTNYSSY
jgi:hypothetical protein